MRINKVVLKNFNSFEGENEFDFTSKKENRNIVLIGGKNGAGKTSLFSAIKIALYGPLAFGYLGVNPRYISKIKEYINLNTFQTSSVESGIDLSFSLLIDREEKEYVISRGWKLESKKIVESLSVYEGGRRLNEQEASFFQNCLLGIVPPDLFEFFLFDGEAVGEIFSTNTYNKYVKDAIYTLCGLDTFELIRKYSDGYVGKTSNDEEERIKEEYEATKEELEQLNELKKGVIDLLEKDQEELDNIETELLELEESFKKAGGISQRKQKELSEKFTDAERIKIETSARIKQFVEGLMPFYIVKEYNNDILNQLDSEEKYSIYKFIEEKLDKNQLEAALSNKSEKKSLDKVLDIILSQLKPDEINDGFEEKFCLSKEESGRVNALISSVSSFDKEELIRQITLKKEAQECTAEINRILKNAISDDLAREYTQKENELLKRKDDLTRKIFEEQVKETELAKQVSELTVQKEKAKTKLSENLQNKHIFELSNGLSSMMSELLVRKMAEIKDKLELLIVDNLKKIYRKDNLVTHIEITEDFQFNLYQDSSYYPKELINLANNIGKDGFEQTIGETGKRILFEKYHVETVDALLGKLPKDDKKKIKLYKRIDLGRLSKGERQIFILSLYWAIIELSGKDIPFVIDTPYARIDKNHRKEISKEFFPAISGQVVILSTDEEVTEEYYKILKSHVSKTYLLINDANQNKTTVKTGYFFDI